MVRRSGTPNVWVKDLTEHTPAHRVTNPDQYFDHNGQPVHPAPAFYRIACPPGLITDGLVISRAQAAAIKVFPCMRCFNLSPAAGKR